jgi:hypothetical protein
MRRRAQTDFDYTGATLSVIAETQQLTGRRRVSRRRGHGAPRFAILRAMPSRASGPHDSPRFSPDGCSTPSFAGLSPQQPAFPPPFARSCELELLVSPAGPAGAPVPPERRSSRSADPAGAPVPPVLPGRRSRRSAGPAGPAGLVGHAGPAGAPVPPVLSVPPERRFRRSCRFRRSRRSAGPIRLEPRAGPAGAPVLPVPPERRHDQARAARRSRPLVRPPRGSSGAMVEKRDSPKGGVAPGPRVGRHSPGGPRRARSGSHARARHIDPSSSCAAALCCDNGIRSVSRSRAGDG